MADPLISIEELAAALGDPELRIIDTRWYLDEPERGAAEYAAGHIPGAQYFDLEEHLSGRGGPGRHPLPPPSTFAATLGRHGIGNEHLVVAYDDRGGAVAARLWWMLRWVGHDRVLVLDGGLPAWTAAGNPVTTDDAGFPPASFEVRPPLTRDIERASLLSNLGSLPVVDARSPERYRGDEEPVDPVAGHIPTARNAPYESMLNASGKLADPGMLADRFREMGADGPNVVVYCGSGVTACLDVLAMVRAGLPEPMLYVGSWSDWGSAGMPAATGPEPGGEPPSADYEVPPIRRQIVQVAEYEVTGDPDAFVAAVEAVAAVVGAQGVGTMARYTFYLDREAGTVTSVIVHRDADSWVRHHEMLEQWSDEFAALKQTFHQTRLRLFGPVSPAMRSWLTGRGVAFEEGGTLAAGFER